LDGLRQVLTERQVQTTFHADEELIVAGEQLGKRRIMTANNVLTWSDFFDGRKIRFATFLSPGRYSVGHAWKNEYWRVDRFEMAILRDILSPARAQPLQELELLFSSSKEGGQKRFLVSGFDLKALPQLASKDYPQGLYMPMGIGVPPFFQTYEDLQQNPPQKSPYFSVLLDEADRWIDHHRLAIDGPVLHRDERDPNRLHVYFLSYERHTLIAHVIIGLGK